MFNKLRAFILKQNLDKETRKEYEILTRFSGNINISLLPSHVNIVAIKKILSLEGFRIADVQNVIYFGTMHFQRVVVTKEVKN